LRWTRKLSSTSIGSLSSKSAFLDFGEADIRKSIPRLNIAGPRQMRTAAFVAGSDTVMISPWKIELLDEVNDFRFELNHFSN